MFAFSYLPLRLTGLPVIQPDFLVCTHTHQVRSIRAERYSVDISLVFPQAGVEFERRSMEKCETRIIAPRSCS